MLSGKTAFITGCNRGIGLAMLREFIKNGASVIAHARQETEEFKNKLLELSLQLNNEEGQFLDAIYFDLGKPEEVKSSIREFMKKKQAVDILINNAGVVHNSLVHRSTLDELEEIFQINVFAPFMLMQNFSRLMIKNGGGSIINISSIAGKDARFGRSIYCSSKAALIGLTESMSKELGGNNIRVNAIAPGIIKTDMIKLQDDDFVEQCVAETDMRRQGLPTDVANTAIFLASDKSSFISGQVIVVDGGLIRF